MVPEGTRDVNQPRSAYSSPVTEVDEFAAMVGALCKFYDELPEVTMDSGVQRTVILAHGWYVSALRTSQAILALETQGLGHEAAPLRRSLIEHSLGLVWLSEATEDAVNSVLRGYKDVNLKKLKASLESHAPELTEELANILDFEIPRSGRASICMSSISASASMFRGSTRPGCKIRR